MAPPPEYDKEPKAPDKSATNIPGEDPKALYNLVNEHQNNSDTKSTNSSGNAEVENNKHVETLDDGQLRALLDEAITYKCPKDREGKSSLFKELLEEVEQDEQACEAAARLPGRARRAGAGRGRRPLPHSNSLQDLVAALAAEPAPRRRLAPQPAPVSARAIHGGSLPSGVDTSFLLSEEPMRGAEYVATVRCVNPSPLAERRVSASDADPDTRDRRRAPAFPMTYTARATLEIGSGSVGSGRAVTCTTASNQVRTRRASPPLPAGKRRQPRGPQPDPQDCAPPRDHALWTLDKWYRGLQHYRPPLGAEPFPPRRSRPDDSAHSCRPGPQNLPKSTYKTSFVNTSRLKLIPKCDTRHIPVVREHETTVKLNDDFNESIDRDNETALAANDLEEDEEEIAREKYRALVGSLVPPKLLPMNPKNVRSMTIAKPLPHAVNSDKRNQNPSVAQAAADKSGKDKHYRKKRNRNDPNANVNVVTDKTHPTEIAGDNSGQNNIYCNIPGEIVQSYPPKHPTHTYPKSSKSGFVSVEHDNKDAECDNNDAKSDNKDLKGDNKETENDKGVNSDNKNAENDNNESDSQDTPTSFTKLQVDTPKTNDNMELVEMVSLKDSSKSDDSNEFSLFIANQQRLLQAIESNNVKNDAVYDENISTAAEPAANNTRSETKDTDNAEKEPTKPNSAIEKLFDVVSMMDCSDDSESENRSKEIVKIKGAVNPKVSEEKPRAAELPSDSSLFLTLYKRLLASPSNIENPVVDIKSAGDAKPVLAGLDPTANRLPKKKKDKITSRLARKPHNENSNKKKDIIRNALKKLFFDNIMQSDSTNRAKSVGKDGATATTSEQVDSAIPFSCISSPEVVASCTTTASAQAAAPQDSKPLQLGSCYRAVASLTGAAWERPEPSPAPASAAAPLKKRTHHNLHQMARNSLTATFAPHGGPLPRAGPAFTSAAAVAVAAADEFKKSLDENGNSVQGFSSPQSGSSQQKKQRRKKSSKNETVIKSHHIDGYQGNKDLNEVLRFIESAPERAKRDDKKKRSAERRKDKPPRAASLDNLRAPPAAPPPARPARLPPPKPERRSWGDDARAYFRDRDPEPDAAELTDFQTVTKKRRPRRARADPPAPRAPSPRDAPGPRSPPSPRARSDRSNDSTDDLDSVHSLPALPARAPASYADIARTRHNIPDLIESCNYYAEEQPAAPEPAAPRADAAAYPALEARRRARADLKPAGAGAAAGAGAGAARRKERSPPAPDVVADRRPPVVLRDSAARGRDMDGVTFGFDVNEQLLGGRAPAQPRCDLVRSAAPPQLRYVPPPPPPHTAHLHQIIDYVGTAWEDVVRCGGKVRYFSE